MNRLNPCVVLFVALLLGCGVGVRAEDKPWVVYEGKDGPGKGKHIVFVTGDEEYRSEEGMPMVARILAERHGFKCTVLFAINKQTGEIDPGAIDNSPGLEQLKSADLMVMFIRWRNWPDNLMKQFLEYADSGKPIVALRTATHPFKLESSKTYIKYTWDYAGQEYKGGFGRQVLGETWVNHHGHHNKESTRGIVAPGQESHPIVRGIKEGEIWGPTDVYTIQLPLPGDSQPVVLGQVLVGMNKGDKPVEGRKNSPMMPIAWTKTYKGKEGQVGRVFTTTMGSAEDLVAPGTRRMVVNAIFWAAGLEDAITDAMNIEPVVPYKPTPSVFGGHKKGVKPADLQ